MIKTMFISCFLPIRKQSFPLQGDREDAANYPGAVQGRVFVVVGSGFVGPVQCPTPGAGCLQELFPGQLAKCGKRLITIDKWFPSSKLCRHCGYVNSKLTLSDRV